MKIENNFQEKSEMQFRKNSGYDSGFFSLEFSARANGTIFDFLAFFFSSCFLWEFRFYVLFIYK